MKVRTVAIAGLTAGALAVTLPLPAGASSPNAKVTSKTCTYGTQAVTSYTHYVNGAEVRYAKPVQSRPPGRCPAGLSATRTELAS